MTGMNKSIRIEYNSQFLSILEDPSNGLRNINELGSNLTVLLPPAELVDISNDHARPGTP
jgi:hypothetical protein